MIIGSLAIILAMAMLPAIPVGILGAILIAVFGFSLPVILPNCWLVSSSILYQE